MEQANVTGSGPRQVPKGKVINYASIYGTALEQVVKKMAQSFSEDVAGVQRSRERRAR